MAGSAGICLPVQPFRLGTGWWIAGCMCGYATEPIADYESAVAALKREHSFTPAPAEGCRICGQVADGAGGEPWLVYRLERDVDAQKYVYVCRDQPACRQRFHELAVIPDEPAGGGNVVSLAGRGFHAGDARRLQELAAARKIVDFRVTDEAANQQYLQFLGRCLRKGATVPQLAAALGKRPGQVRNNLINAGLVEQAEL